MHCSHLKRAALPYHLTSLSWSYYYWTQISKTDRILWSSGQRSWLQIQRSGFASRRYQIFWKVVGLERRLLSLVSTIEELLGRKCSGSSLENREYGRRDQSRWPRGTLYSQKLTLTSTSGGRSVVLVRWRTKATKLLLLLLLMTIIITIITIVSIIIISSIIILSVIKLQ
jgi:hypothetical protein